MKRYMLYIERKFIVTPMTLILLYSDILDIENARYATMDKGRVLVHLLSGRPPVLYIMYNKWLPRYTYTFIITVQITKTANDPQREKFIIVWCLVNNEESSST